MIGTGLVWLLVLLLAARFRGIAPAARVALAAAIAVGAPVLALSAVARVGVNSSPAVVTAVFAVIAAVFWALTAKRAVIPDDPRWIGMTALACALALLSALVGRPPASGVLIDPWAHIAWSRDLRGVFELYPPGFPAFISIVGFDDPLVGAFRLASFILHFALAAQFLALGEAAGTAWPAGVGALAYLVVPVAFNKFDPPRPELLAAVFIAASWWILLGTIVTRYWNYAALGFLTCVLVVSHASTLEIAHLAAVVAVAASGALSRTAGSRTGLLASLALGVVASFAVSPWPLTVLSHPGSVPLVSAPAGTAPFPGAGAVARMWGPGLCVAGAAWIAWFLSHARKMARSPHATLAGILLFAILTLVPLLATAAGFELPIPLEAFRHYLSAALPLTLGAALVGGMAWRDSRAGRIGVIVCAVVVAADFGLRPTFQPATGVAAIAVGLAIWWTARRPHRTRTLAAVLALAIALNVGVRALIWLPKPPPEAAWLAARGDPRITVVSNWPLTNTFDALAPQQVVDGLAGNDATAGRHRSLEISPLHARLDWCGDHSVASADTLAAALREMNLLPAYVIVGDRFEESWALYAEQRRHLATSGRPNDRSFWVASPCPEPAKARVANIRRALELRPGVRLEFSTDGVAVYRMDKGK